MVNISNSSHMEWFFVNKPPFFFSRIDYSYWKTRIIKLLKSIDYHLWEVIQMTPTFQSKLRMKWLFQNLAKNKIRLKKRKLN